MAGFVHMSDEQLRRTWITYFALGVILVLLGTAGLCYSAFFTLLTVEYFGFIVIAGGVLQTVHGFWRRHWGGFFLDTLSGLLYLAVGLIFVVHPVNAAAALTLFIAFALVLSGLFRVFVSISGWFPHWIWLLAHGVISIALGVLIWRGWPETAFWVIGMFVAIDLLFNVWTLIMLGLGLRNTAVKTGGTATV